MENNSWIKLYRKILNNDQLWGSTLTFGLFIYFLLIADKDGKCTVGRFELARRFRAKPSTIYKVIQRLESNNQVTTKGTSRYTEISVCNWEKYQVGFDKVTPKVAAKEQPSNTLIRIKNKNNIINIGNEEVENVYNSYKEMRNKIRKPLTDKADELIRKKLCTLADNEADRIAILEQSIENSWQGVFPLRGERGTGRRLYIWKSDQRIETTEQELQNLRQRLVGSGKTLAYDKGKDCYFIR